MFPPGITVEKANSFLKNTMMEHLGMEYTEIGPDYICARMPVDKRTRQPAGLLHGGASAALAESLGSAGSALLTEVDAEEIRGIELNINHIGGIGEGYVVGKAILLHKGRTTHVWDIRISSENTGKKIAIARLTVLVLQKHISSR